MSGSSDFSLLLLWLKNDQLELSITTPLINILWQVLFMLLSFSDNICWSTKIQRKSPTRVPSYKGIDILNIRRNPGDSDDTAQDDS